MGDLGSGISSALSGLGNMFAPNAANAATNSNIIDPNQITDNTAGPIVDPTGSATATYSITGGPAADQPVDLGGAQSDASGGPQQQQPQQPPPQPPPQQQPQQPQRVADASGQTVPAGPTGWKPQTDFEKRWGPYDPQSFNQRFRPFDPVTGGQTVDKQLPEWMQGAQKSVAAPPDPSTSDGYRSRTPAEIDEGIRRYGVGRGGEPGGGPPPQMMPRFPGPLGGLISNILGVLSGNPQSLGGLVGNAMRGGMGGPGGGMSPYGVPWTSLPMAPGWSYNPQTGQYTRTPGSRPGVPTARPAGGEFRPAVGEFLNNTGRPPGGAPVPPDPAQVARVGQAAGTPLQKNEVTVPEWSKGGQGGGPSMRPTQPSVDRSRFANENNDQMAYRAAWMVNGEIGLNRDSRNQIIQLETAFNRAHYRNHSLAHSLLDNRSGGGYYDGTSPTPTYRISARPTPEQFERFKREVWEPVMKGSNLSDIGWGPMTGNASGGLAQRDLRKMNGYTTRSGETYFREDPVRGNLPAIQQQSPFPNPGNNPVASGLGAAGTKWLRPAYPRDVAPQTWVPQPTQGFRRSADIEDRRDEKRNPRAELGNLIRAQRFAREEGRDIPRPIPRPYPLQRDIGIRELEEELDNRAASSSQEGFSR